MELAPSFIMFVNMFDYVDKLAQEMRIRMPSSCMT